MSAVSEFRWPSQTPKLELRPLFQNSPLGLVRFQREGSITAINPALEQVLRATPKSSPLLFTDLLHPRNHSESESLLRELFAGERESFQIDSVSTDGNDRPTRWTAWRVSGTNGDSDYALALAESIPENPEAEQRLRQAERLETVGRLAGGVAHDFNNLLTGILLYCDLLMASLEPSHRVRKYAEEIRNAGMQASGLVRQLLSVSRPTSSEPRLLSLNEVVEGMRNLLDRLIGENIKLKFDLDSKLGLVKMDPTQAQQILLNLVLNARDALPGGGKITVATSNCKVQILADQSPAENQPTDSSGDRGSLPCALFVVQDTGTGMDAATRAHLFEVFFTTKAAGKGTGLGLATVYSIVSSNGGLIHVDSAPDCGTRISVLLPLVPEGPVNSQTEDEPQEIEGVFSAREKE